MTNERTGRVSVVSGDPDWLIRLSEAVDGFETFTYQSTVSAIAQITHGEPGVVVVGPAEAHEFLAQPSHETPQAAVVLVVEEPSVDLLRQAFVAGVGDVIGVGQLADLAAAVRAQQERIKRWEAPPDEPGLPRTPRHGKVVVVTSAKAGQGSTTVAANLAVTLARRGRVALVEGDPVYGDLLAAFGYRQTRTEVVSAQDVVGDHWLGRYLYRHPSGVVLAIPSPDAAADFQPEHAIDALTALQSEVDTVVLDVPLWALERYRLHRAADEVLLVSTDRTRDLAHARTAVREMGDDVAHTHLVVSNYVDGRTPKRSDMATITGLGTLGRIPEDDDAEASIGRGEPVVTAKPKGPVALAFAELADALAEVLAPRG
jgi:MinD-like ATPase involved in chromosome partitioning or flagellar assembly